MKTVSLGFKTIAVLALAIGMVCAVIHVRAQDQSHFVPTPQFGIIGMTRGQTARFTVANVSSASNPFYPPDPAA